MKVLRTPDYYFDNLQDYPFLPKYMQVADDLIMHYVDEGPRQGRVVLMLHGEPSWSYLYRKMIPVFVKAGFRAIAPDLIGFGKSDKPSSKRDYTYKRHVKWTTNFVKGLNLQDITLFCQDWGGLIGLRLAIDEADRFSNIVVANTGLPNGMVAPPKVFTQWQEFSKSSPVFDIGQVISNATVTELSPEVVNDYNAPFPNDKYKAGARIFPSLVPTAADDPEAKLNQKYWQRLMEWKKPLLTLFSDKDPITKGGEKYFQKVVPGAKGQAHTTIEAGGHFLQEDKGEEIAKLVVKFMKKR